MAKEKPRVLIFIDWFTPGYKAGGPIQSCANLVDHLCSELEFYIITRDTDYCEAKPYNTIVSNTWNRLQDNVWVYYLSSDKLSYYTLSAVTREITPNTVFINGIYSLYFSIMPLIIVKQLKYRNILISARGMLAPSAIAVKRMRKKTYLKIAQLLGLYKGVVFHATNSKEKTNIKVALGKTIPVKIAPNLPRLKISSPETIKIKREGELKLLSVARIAPEKNIKFALEILTKCEGLGNIQFDLYGPIYNKSYWSECLELLKLMPPNVRVNYKGSLESTEVASTMSRYHVLLMPSRGENFGHVILESFTAGCPVIISDQTPWRNLEEQQIGYDLSLTDIDKFVACIGTLASLDQAAYNYKSDKALKYSRSILNNQEAIELNRVMFQSKVA